MAAKPLANHWWQTGIGWFVRCNRAGFRLVTVCTDGDWFTGDPEHPECGPVEWRYDGGGRHAADLHLLAAGYELSGGAHPEEVPG